ncbi:hypothetical protein [Paenibacillus polymyxa]|uniref:hypothetical protein n=1 Tax=Paenibacillus polymyxa TaxID=1406 RepID=UPI00046EC3FE|nr:hypothetical protein [Paenibacillus polymyxa]
MLYSLDTLIEPMIRTRLELLYANLLESKTDYIELSTSCDQYFQQIRASVPDKLQHVIFLYEDTQISLQAILENSIYLQGFKDALQLLDEVKNN